MNSARNLTWRWMAPLVLALMVEACSAGESTSKETPARAVKTPSASVPPAPGLYGPKDACAQVVFKEQKARAGWRFCVDRVTVAEDGGLTFGTSWTLFGTPEGPIQKGPDAGNRNMFIVDDQGRRHDHHDTTLAAKVGGSLSERGERLEGAFLFRAPSPGSSRFDFHDDDQGVLIRNIVLDASRQMVTEAERGRVTQKVLAAQDVEIVESWDGMGPASHGQWRLHGGAAGFSGDAKVPAEAAHRFLEILSEAPLRRGQYQATFSHTDDYPRLSILVGVGADIVGFFSESQERGHVPWGARTYTAVFVVDSDHPARAIESLRPYLGNAPEDKGPRSRITTEVSPRQRDLMAAVFANDLARVQALLHDGADLRTVDFPQVGLLDLVISQGNLDMLRALLAKGAPVDALDAERATPLLAAARHGRLDMVEALLVAGARPDLATRNGFTPLHAAAFSASPEVVERLLQAGIPPDVRTRYGTTPLMCAGSPAVTKVLLLAGADPNATSLLATPLSMARGGRLPDPEIRGSVVGALGSAPQVRALLEAGAKEDAPDRP